MLFALRRSLLRAPAALRAAPAPVSAPWRLFTSSALRLASGPPIIQGEGSAAGEVPTDEQQATGLERLELMGKLQGIDIFDMEPLHSTRLGTMKDPVMIKSYWPSRIVGCSGFPADSHDTIYLDLNRDLKHHRCPECGNVFSLDYQGEEHVDHHGQEH